MTTTTATTATTATTVTSATTPTRQVDVAGTRFAYRELGPSTGVPLVLLHHFAATIDDWDPRVLDGIAAERRVVVFDNRGIGETRGRVPSSVEAMAEDATAHDSPRGSFPRGRRRPHMARAGSRGS